MYSEIISKFFKEHNITVGDIVKVDAKGITEEGELMPSTEANDSGIIIVKLKSGYNIGINFKEAKISRVSRGKPYGEFPRADLKYKEGLPKIKLVYTGGTIGSKVDYKTGGVYMLTKPEELLYEIPELSDIAHIRACDFLHVASEDMSTDDWGKIAKEVGDSLNDGFRGAIVTMGTDTMHYTVSALSFMLEGLNSPVVVTGAQRSPDRGSSDAFLNLICSAHIAAKSNIAEVGICMHYSSNDDKCAFIRGTRARKMHTSRRDAFRAVNSRPIAFVDSKGEIAYNSDYKKLSKNFRSKVKIVTGFEKKVALIKAYPNSDPEIIDFYVGKGCRGLIIEGTGLGHTPALTENKNASWLSYIKNAIDNGVVVGMTSQCLYGRVNGMVYRTLRLLSGLGVIYCEDMLPEVAYIKLGWLLGNYRKEKAAKLLAENLAGEISTRSEYDEFLA